MLNTGPRIFEAIKALTDILSRMRGHADKKRPFSAAWMRGTSIGDGSPTSGHPASYISPGSKRSGWPGTS